MGKAARVFICLFLCAAVVSGSFVSGLDTSGPLEMAADFMLRDGYGLQPGYVGGDWAVVGLARGGRAVSDKYYESVESALRDCGGVLSRTKHTEYSRLILALTAIGKDPQNAAGYNLLLPLGDFDGTLKQGINGAIWALIALDSGGYAIPENPEAKTQATRQMYIDAILSRELSDGGWAMSDINGSDPDMTAMALAALSKYSEQQAVSVAIEKGLDVLSQKQEPDGGYSSWGAQNCDSTAQVIIALCELGISVNDSRFTKNGLTPLDSLLSYQLSDGSFAHEHGGGTSGMSTEQAFMALVSLDRLKNGLSPIFSMDAAKAPQIAVPPVTNPGASFPDASGGPAAALAARGIVNGYENGEFRPGNTLTRAEFAAAVTRALGLGAEHTGKFSDVPANKWYAGFVGAAEKYGIVQGVGGGKFNPDGTVTRQEAAVMTARASKLCGMDTALTEQEAGSLINDAEIASWARVSAAFCLKYGIIESLDSFDQPITRGEMAEMIYNMLTSADLL